MHILLVLTFFLVQTINVYAGFNACKTEILSKVEYKGSETSNSLTINEIPLWRVTPLSEHTTPVDSMLSLQKKLYALNITVLFNLSKEMISSIEMNNDNITAESIFQTDCMPDDLAPEFQKYIPQRVTYVEGNTKHYLVPAALSTLIIQSKTGTQYKRMLVLIPTNSKPAIQNQRLKRKLLSGNTEKRVERLTTRWDVMPENYCSDAVERSKKKVCFVSPLINTPHQEQQDTVDSSLATSAIAESTPVQSPKYFDTSNPPIIPLEPHLSSDEEDPL